ncbi:inactive protein RESTRICTED TEV MOVEMENT 2-like [Phragmites australis]|uniref:inactive protein RESTRICTED TEV MOVEMENT 2-like n=1 Tax=Phragmites australis TaxID=29695 RepID=UPI002D798C38|nr:inactive protein RESTRICTED TEV MOVEMENT 2-like [Phragmites australis]
MQMTLVYIYKATGTNTKTTSRSISTQRITFSSGRSRRAASMNAARGINRTYEEYDPTVEWSRAAEADTVKISLPGFKKEELQVVVDSHGHMQARGTRPVAGTRWSRFQKDFKLPQNCNVDGIRAKFENETLTITLPKKSPSPQAVAPAPPSVPEPRRPAKAPPQKPPQAPPEPPRPAPSSVPAKPLVPATSRKLQPAPSQKQPAQRRPSALEPAPAVPARLPSVPTPAPEVEPPKTYNGGAAITKPEPVAAIPKPKEQEQVKEAKKPSLEEEKRMEREAMGKMGEDRKAIQEKEKEEEKAKEEAAVMGEMDMARRPRPISASRGMLVNVAVAVVVLIGITVYVWHTLRNATGGAGDHGELGSGSNGDEM